MPAKHGVAHVVEEAAALLRWRLVADLRLQFFDAGVGALARNRRRQCNMRYITTATGMHR